MYRAVRKKLEILKRAVTRESGSATIEFVILFPAIMTLFFSVIEVSIFMARDVMLERSLDMSVRLLRLGQLDPATQEHLQQLVCDNAMIFKDCQNSIKIELTRISTTSWNMPATNVTCVDRTEEIQPEVGFDTGNRNDLMLVRACAVVDPFFGTTPLVMNLPTDDSGGYSVVAMSTFVNEP
jgi:Flp pilus assembly protein TadG